MLEQNIIAILRNLLCDSGYSSDDVKEYVSRRGFCLECLENNARCECCVKCGSVYCNCSVESQR